jgi:hypothetical protein
MLVINFLVGIHPFFQLAKQERMILKEFFAHAHYRAKDDK